MACASTGCSPEKRCSPPAVDASKVALVRLVERLRQLGVVLLDVQWTTPHLVSLGAVDVERRQYLDLLTGAVQP